MGSVIAGSLAKADPTLQILIVEAGLNNRDDPNITTPAFAFRNLAQPDSPYFDQYIGKPSDYVNGRNYTVPTGRVLGGGSSVNFMMYTRPAASDFDDWNTKGWSFNDLEPLFKKVGKRSISFMSSTKRIISKKVKSIMDIMDQLTFLMVEPRASFRLIFLMLQKGIMESTLL